MALEVDSIGASLDQNGQTFVHQPIRLPVESDGATLQSRVSQVAAACRTHEDYLLHYGSLGDAVREANDAGA